MVDKLSDTQETENNNIDETYNDIEEAIFITPMRCINVDAATRIIDKIKKTIIDKYCTGGSLMLCDIVKLCLVTPKFEEADQISQVKKQTKAMTTNNTIKIL